MHVALQYEQKIVQITAKQMFTVWIAKERYCLWERVQAIRTLRKGWIRWKSRQDQNADMQGAYPLSIYCWY
jgi:hypothetical protein